MTSHHRNLVCLPSAILLSADAFCLPKGYMGKVHYTMLNRLIKRDGNLCHYCGIRVYPCTDFTSIDYHEDNPYLYKTIKRYIPFVVVSAEKYDSDLEETVYCEIAYDPNCNVATGDHIVPIAKGGSNKIDNLVVCCFPCNSQKGVHYDYQTFKAMKAKGVHNEAEFTE